MERVETLGEVTWVNWALHAMESERAAIEMQQAFQNSWRNKGKHGSRGT